MITKTTRKIQFLIPSNLKEVRPAADKVLVFLKDLSLIASDQFDIRLCFEEALINAIKYGKSAQVSIAILAEQVQIKVIDQGPGISSQEQEKVFMPFYRVDQARSPQTVGVGLGLAVARDIIRAHGGEIELKNRQPHGLCVIVTLPI